MRRVMLIAVLSLVATPGFAQRGFSPLSGPNDPVPSPVCDFINFGFCPQPPGPPAPLPDLDRPPPRVVPPATDIREPVHHRRRHPVEPR